MEVYYLLTGSYGLKRKFDTFEEAKQIYDELVKSDKYYGVSYKYHIKKVIIEEINVEE